MPLQLLALPFDVLEHVAYFAATTQVEGPPSNTIVFSQASKALYQSLSFEHNPGLYSRIFRFKFDVDAPLRRFGPKILNGRVSANELRTRFQMLKRLRNGIGYQAKLRDVETQQQDLWTAVLMMLENDGKNSKQLKEYGRIDPWLKAFFLDTGGGSYAEHDLVFNHWPRDNLNNRIALWLLCLCEAEDTFPDHAYDQVIRAYAVNALQYSLTPHHWHEFDNRCKPITESPLIYYDRNIKLTTPSICLSAVFLHIARVVPMTHSTLAQLRSPKSGSLSSSKRIESLSKRWDTDWLRISDLGQGELSQNATGHLPHMFHVPGSFGSTWQGLFTYTEFGVYAAIFSGDSPSILQDGAIGQNHQTWRLREYNLLMSDKETFVPIGEPSCAFFSEQTRIREELDDNYAIFDVGGLECRYRRATRGATIDPGDALRDVIIVGEGHSSWGDFKLRGRVRAGDGLVTILKQYDGPDDRGRWLYRGYLFGGKFLGRWRDSTTPSDHVGYEGGFEMSPRI